MGGVWGGGHKNALKWAGQDRINYFNYGERLVILKSTSTFFMSTCASIKHINYMNKLYDICIVKIEIEKKP